jgi:hypothetical protein
VNVRSIFTEPNQPSHPAYRYGALVFILSLLAWEICRKMQLPPRYSGDPYGTGVVLLMLLLNHLAYQFRWPTPVTIAFRVAALGWLVFGSFYIFYLAERLYP